MAYNSQVARVQSTLKAFNNPNFNPGVVDGLWGPNTLRAVRNFRAARGLDPDPGTAVGDYLDAQFEAALFAATQQLGVTAKVPPPPPVVGPSNVPDFYPDVEEVQPPVSPAVAPKLTAGPSVGTLALLGLGLGALYVYFKRS